MVFPTRSLVAALALFVGFGSSIQWLLADDQGAEVLYRRIGTCLRDRDISTAAASFAEMERSFPKHNRTGCAALYVAQIYLAAHENEHAEKFLRQAIEQYPTCRYGDGVQVGAYATYMLAELMLQQGRTQEGEKLRRQIVDQYPQAVDHRGRPLVSLIRTDKRVPGVPPKATLRTLQFTLYDAFGRQVRSSDYHGRPLLIEFGACW